MKHNERRHFIKQTSTVGLGMAIMPNLTFGGHFGKKTEKLKVGLIGVGLRGTNHLNNLAQRDDVEIRAICDIDPDRIKVAKDILAQRNARDPRVFGKNEKDYLNLLELDEIDAVLIATPWLWHTRMAVDAMEAGKYTALEVSAANTLEECWDLVNTHERTGSHLMILENVSLK